MNEEELSVNLNRMGIDASDALVLALLPLVEVAWADGRVQGSERHLISKLTDDPYDLSEDARRLVEDWLQYSPSPQYYRRGRAVLVELARAGAVLDVAALDRVMDGAVQIANASGGLFGWRAVSSDKRAVLESIATDFGSVGGKERSFDPGLLDDLDEQCTDVFGPADLERMIEEVRKETGRDPRAELSPVPGSGAVVVHLVDGGDRAFRIDGEGVTIGRSSRNTVQVADDSKVSRFHCRIFAIEGAYFVEDRSTNGTLVNGERVHRRQLFGGEEVQVASARFRFHRTSPEA